MSDRVGLKVRRLPDGEFQEAQQVSLDGRFLEFELIGGNLSLGSLLEIERGSTLFWGQLQRLEGATAIVSLEHSLDTSKLQPIREVWGEQN